MVRSARPVWRECKLQAPHTAHGRLALPHPLTEEICGDTAARREAKGRKGDEPNALEEHAETHAGGEWDELDLSDVKGWVRCHELVVTSLCVRSCGL